MANHVLKGALFGGFKRSDVIGYIEESSKESAEIVKKLQEENDSLRGEKDVLLSQLAEKQELPEKLEMLSREKTALSERLETAEAALTQAEAERDSLRAELERVRPLAEEYQTIRERLSEIQIEACRRAKEVETQTNARLLSLLRDCRGVYEEAFLNRFPAAFDELEQSLRAEPAVSEAPAAEGAAETAEKPFETVFSDMDDTAGAADAPFAPVSAEAEYPHEAAETFSGDAAPAEPAADSPMENAPDAEAEEPLAEVAGCETDEPSDDPASFTWAMESPAAQPEDEGAQSASMPEEPKPEAESPDPAAEQSPTQEDAPAKEDSPFTFTYDDFKL